VPPRIWVVERYNIRIDSWYNRPIEGRHTTARETCEVNHFHAVATIQHVRLQNRPDEVPVPTLVTTYLDCVRRLTTNRPAYPWRSVKDVKSFVRLHIVFQKSFCSPATSATSATVERVFSYRDYLCDRIEHKWRTKCYHIWCFLNATNM